jgi:hypothetical protein
MVVDGFDLLSDQNLSVRKGMNEYGEDGKRDVTDVPNGIQRVLELVDGGDWDVIFIALTWLWRDSRRRLEAQLGRLNGASLFEHVEQQ